MELTKKNIIGSLYWDVFVMDDGSKIRVASTEKKYKGLAIKNPTNPTIKNGKWKYSYSANKYNTANGELENGMYGTEDNQHIVKLENKMEAVIPLKEISNNTISQKGQEVINKNHIKLLELNK